jgi:methionine biosynthesis protein MetW
MPVTRDLPHSWYDTPNIHFCTIRDFVALCDEVGATVERAMALDVARGIPSASAMPWWFWNLFGAAGGVRAEAGVASLRTPLPSSCSTASPN